MTNTLDDMLTRTVTPDLAWRELTRCDHCRVAGKVRWILLSGRDLVFCDHHANTYGTQLVAAGAVHHRLTN